MVYAWILVGILIAMLEAYALMTHTKGDTLSETIWSLTAKSRLLRIAITLFWCWLGLHFFGPRGWY